MEINNEIFPKDTDKDALIKQFDILKKMDIAERAKMTFQLSANLREIVESGIRHRHPDYSQQQITQAVLSLTIDKELFKQAFPHSRVKP